MQIVTNKYFKLHQIYLVKQNNVVIFKNNISYYMDGVHELYLRTHFVHCIWTFTYIDELPFQPTIETCLPSVYCIYAVEVASTIYYTIQGGLDHL